MDAAESALQPWLAVALCSDGNQRGTWRGSRMASVIARRDQRRRGNAQVDTRRNRRAHALDARHLQAHACRSGTTTDTQSMAAPASRPSPPASRTGAQVMCEALIRENVEVMFGIPGGAIMPFYHAMWEYRYCRRHVLCRHEQGAGHAAEGYARSTGKVGVCVATSGPGATNLVTPIANAWMDSTPLVAITGQVSSSLIGTDAFQEIDATGITMPIVKHSWLVQDVEELPGVLKAAFHLARTSRPGPLVVDNAKDVPEGE